jgi:hypothetical protein
VQREVEKVVKSFFWRQQYNGAVSEVGKRGRGIGGREMGGEEGGAGGVEEGALATGMGGPGEEVRMVGMGEVGDKAGRVTDAMGGKENRVGIGDDKGGRGCQHGGAIAESTSKADGKGVGVEVGSKEVVSGEGSAFAEELGTGLEIEDATV